MSVLKYLLGLEPSAKAWSWPATKLPVLTLAIGIHGLQVAKANALERLASIMH